MSLKSKKLIAPVLLCVFLISLILLAPVDIFECYEMCTSKLLNTKNQTSLNEQLSIEGLTDHCYYVESNTIKELHSKDSDLGLIQINIRGLLNKQSEIKQLLSSDNVSLSIDVILLCETWLKPTTLDFFDLPNYKSFHKIQRDHIGGGTSILVNDRL